MKKNYTKKLSGYSSMAASLFLMHAKVDAQIIYNNIDPDITLDINESATLDINADGTDDIVVRQFYDFIYSSFCLVESGIIASMHPLNKAQIKLHPGGLPFPFSNGFPHIGSDAYPIYLNHAGDAMQAADEWIPYFTTMSLKQIETGGY